MELVKVEECEYTGTKQHDHAAFCRQWLVENGYDLEFEVVAAKANQLFLDYDNHSVPPQFKVTMDILMQALNLTEELPYAASVSKSGNVHIIVELPRYMVLTERIAWQAAFGSDPKNCALQLLSVRKRELNPILLYNRKEGSLASDQKQHQTKTDDNETHKRTKGKVGRKRRCNP
jgi:hypothetical protein